MLPLALDPKHARIGLAGSGALAVRRLAALRAAGMAGVLVFGAQDAELARAAGADFRDRWPDDAALAELHILYITGLAPEAAGALAATARRLRVLVNVEDVPELCDFHSVAEVRRGDLLLTVSTGGAAPGLASSIRRNLENCFAPIWAERVREVAALRQAWRGENVAMPEAARRIQALADAGCWLNCPRP
jgi:precorrin-2 dehydrogenase/sirohydrochlorin ferrochelatase